MQVHQFHPTVAFGDAISNQMLSLQAMLRAMGCESEIFVEQTPLHFEGRTRPMADYGRFSAPENVLLLHFSLGYAAPVMDWVRQVPDRSVLVYHNITPHRFFAGVNHVYMEAARAGREQLGELAGLVDAGWGDSPYNCQELAMHGLSHRGVLPIVFDATRYSVRPDRRVLREWEEGVNVLFVGRVSPNKRFEDLLLTFRYLKHHVCPDARLLLVGSWTGMEPYLAYLQALAQRLDLVDVVFAGHVSGEALAAYYRCASVYLSMSEHEGFGVPLLESMYFGVPIIAYRVGAVPDTLGDSGVLIREKNYAAVAELIGLLIEDQALQSQIVSRQRDRLTHFEPKVVKPRLAQLLQEIGARV
jgi:glycosyltransferase involved in cell wall biosynthesis